MHLNKCSSPIAVDHQRPSGISSRYFNIGDMTHFAKLGMFMALSKEKLSHFVFSTTGKDLLNLVCLQSSKHITMIIPTAAFENI